MSVHDDPRAQAQRRRLNDCSGGDGGQVEPDERVVGVVRGVVLARIGQQRGRRPMRGRRVALVDVRIRRIAHNRHGRGAQI